MFCYSGDFLSDENKKNVKVFILAGGEGTRLRPYTYTTPKPMLRVGGKPILEYVIRNVKRAGFENIVLTVGYLHEQIEEYFGDGSKFGVSIEYLVEDEKMNTAGSILPYKGKIENSFLVLMGDHLTNIDLDELFRRHKENVKDGAIATIALKEVNSITEYGVVKTDESTNSVVQLLEKPKNTQKINVAIYAFEPEVFNFIKEKEDFAKNVFPRLLENKKKVGYYLFDDVWFDVGRVSDYERLDEIMKVVHLAKSLDMN